MISRDHVRLVFNRMEAKLVLSKKIRSTITNLDQIAQVFPIANDQLG
jgi:hypothetical protein